MIIKVKEMEIFLHVKRLRSLFPRTSFPVVSCMMEYLLLEVLQVKAVQKLELLTTSFRNGMCIEAERFLSKMTFIFWCRCKCSRSRKQTKVSPSHPSLAVCKQM